MSLNLIAQNTKYLTISVIFQKILATIYFIFIARYFTNAEVGEYTNALYLATLFGIFVELGLSAVLIREVAKNKSNAQIYLANITAIKLMALVITYIALVVFVNLAGYLPLSRQLIYIAGAIMIFDSFNVSFYGVLRGVQNFKYEAWGIIIGQVLLVLSGIFAIVNHWPLHFLILAILLSSVFNLIYSSYILKRKLGINIFPRFDTDIVRFLISIGLPFLVFGIFMRFYGYMDTVLLYRLKNSTDVSYYAAAYKITFALSFIPAAFGSALYPAFSQYYISAREKLSNLFERSLYYLMVISVPIAVGVMSMADIFIPIIFGANYGPSVFTLRILMFALVFNYLSFPVGALLNACNYQKQNTLMMGLTLIVNVVANLLLIPILSYIGSAIALILSSAVLFFGPLFYSRKIIALNKKYIIMNFCKTFFSALCMAGVIISFKSHFHFIVVITMACLAYFVALYLIKGYSKQDFNFVVKKILKKGINYEKNTSDNA